MNSSIPRFFPMRLEGEYFYGTLTRWSFMLGTASSKLRLITKCQRTPNPLNDFDGLWLDFLFQLTGNQSNRTALLLESTMLPLYNSFYGTKGDLDTHLIGDFGVNTENAFRYLRWCPLCAQEDKIDIGMSIWKTVHQSPMLLRCIKHDTKLISLVGKQFSHSSPSKVELNHCMKSLSSKIDALNYSQLTPFQQWVERLYCDDLFLNHNNLANTIVEVLKQKLDWKDLSRSKKSCPTKIQFSDYKKILFRNVKASGYEDFLVRGERSFKEIRNDNRLSLNEILLNDQRFSPLIYLLAAWTFLDRHELDKLLGPESAIVSA